jgi:hypothetical protein
MKYSKWIGFLSVVVVLVACHLPWIKVMSAHLEVGGMFSNGKHNFGRPGLMNIICTVGAGIFFLLPQVWAKRTNIFFCGFNIAWAIRNYIMLSRCYSGECPEKQIGLYLLLIASAVMLLMSFLPDLEVDKDRPKEQAG